MTKLRKDTRGRVLRTGESQRKDGRYLYKYTDPSGKTHSVYSWKLVPSDKLPRGKRKCRSLREQEREIQQLLLTENKAKKTELTLCQLYEKQNFYRSNVKKSTKNQRKKLMIILENDPIGHAKIDTIKLSDTKEWAIRMKEKGYSYQTINNHKRTLKATFYIAVEDEYIRKNPFDFLLSSIMSDDTEKKQALTETQIKDFLTFAKEDPTYRKYYDEIIILLNTGIRISELCGLTEYMINLEERVIHIRHQLLRDPALGYYIESPKSRSGIRDIPMSESVYTAFSRVLKRTRNGNSVVIDDHTKFLFLNRKGFPMTNNLYAAIFSNMSKKFNKIYPEYCFLKITPHILRHTFCTRLANRNMNPKNLQYIMGHSNINITLNLYAHASLESIKEEIYMMLE